uniref:Protein S100-A1-like n=2 Tax=Gouania willdenowi TaxID=441366 RepID=A0A8C5GBY4_GOUWI
MAHLESIITDMVAMFEEHAKGDGKINKEEFISLIDKEIKNPEIKAKIKNMDLEKAMERMDKNRDGDIDFREFCKCVCFMAKRCYMAKAGKEMD